MFSRQRRFSLEIFLWISLLLAFATVLHLCKISPFDWFVSDNLFKNNPQYVYKKDFNRLVITENSFYAPRLEKFIANPDLLFENVIHQFTSRYKGKKIAVVHLDGMCFIAHQFKKKSLLQWLTAFFSSPSQAMRTWYYRDLLESNGINCCKPLFLVEKRFGPICTSSYLLTNYILGCTGNEFFSQNSTSKDKWPEVVENIQQVLTRLSDAKIEYSKFAMNDVIIKNSRPYLIDLDKLQRTFYRTKSMRTKTLNKNLSLVENEMLESGSDAYEIFHKKNIIYKIN